MTAEELIIVGCGGFGREVFSMVQAMVQRRDANWCVKGFVDDEPSDSDVQLVAALGATVLGTVSDLAVFGKPVNAVLAVGSARARVGLDRSLATSRVTFPTLVHPDATLGERVSLGPGTVVAPGARISTSVRIGRHVHVDQNATVGHDAYLGDFSRLNPQACLSGSVRVEDRALVGAGAVILQGLLVGADSVVGAGACAVRDVPPGAIVMGVPAR